MIAETDMTLFEICRVLIWEIYKEASKDIERIVILKHSLYDAHKNIMHIKRPFHFKSFDNQKFRGVMLWMLFVETSFQRIGAVEIDMHLESVSQQLRFLQKVK